MQNNAMKPWLDLTWMSASNQSYIENLYKDFLLDPNSVELTWKNIFKKLIDHDVKQYDSARDNFHYFIKDTSCHSKVMVEKNNTTFQQIKVLELINAFRYRGHQQAKLDPLNIWKQDPVPELNLAYYKLEDVDLKEKFYISIARICEKKIKLADIYKNLTQTYCGSIGTEYMHITNPKEKLWIQHHLESLETKKLYSFKDKKEFLKQLTAAEGLERYLGAKFPGAKRFSLEGGDVLVPMLNMILDHAAKNGIREVFLGMAHRGRLNVLINVLGKKPKDIFDEFLGKGKKHFGSGDVKYHMGFSSNIKTKEGTVHLRLVCNPSHLEIVTPVMMGSVRARIDSFNKPLDNQVLPISIHGDAAVIGQGVVQETLNMSKTRGYEVGGTVHIVINNQIGFTTSNADARSTQYCTDIAKMSLAPIFHVNADDLESVIFISLLAIDFRNNFKRDVFIDLVCYRRHGHNEADEPSVTQPEMYKKIKQHPTLRNIYADKLQNENIISIEDSTEMITAYRNSLDIGECVVANRHAIESDILPSLFYLTHDCDENYDEKTIPINRLQQLAKIISNIPKDIEIQSRVAKIYKERLEMAKGNKAFDWGAAENLAYATLLDAGIPCRLSGEDIARGTFFHRHAVIHNQQNNSIYIPLQHIHNKQGAFSIWNSVLSEEAVLAFEYGYATTELRTLTIWEAQFGDFANGAQVVIDQFISSGEQKWGRMCSLVMLLPHGYEGQGPEHSSARLERYLQLCAEQNMQVCVPSTPAQIYHILRRQVLCDMRRPLIVMSPKSLLRHPDAMSSLQDLAYGKFHTVIDEIDDLDTKEVKRVVMCSGKVYYDLLTKRRNNEQFNVVIIRIEQLYPFPYKALRNILEKYSHVHDFIWCQEEPLNQGAWYCSQHNFYKVLPFQACLRYTGRPASASPAVGYMSVHQKQQQDLVDNALYVE